MSQPSGRVPLDTASIEAIAADVAAAKARGWTQEDLKTYFTAKGLPPGVYTQALRGSAIDADHYGILVAISIHGLPEHPDDAKFVDPYPDIPARMKAARRWLLWRSEPNDDPQRRSGSGDSGAIRKPRKIPLYANGERRQGALDGPEDIARLAGYREAIAALTDAHSGLGFALGPDGDGAWQGIDLDDLADHPGLQFVADDLPGYTERSPSGLGVHAIGYGRPFATLGSNSTGIEAYAKGRYFTMTGESTGTGDIEDIADFVEKRLAPLHSPKPQDTSTAPQAGTLLGALAYRDLRSALASMRSDDRELWIRMGHALKTLGEQGRGLFFEWSQTSDKYDAADTARVWDSFKPSATGYQAVFAEAQRQGWINPAAGATLTANQGQPRHDPETGEVIEQGVGQTDTPPPPILCAATLAGRKLTPRPWLVPDMIPGEQVTTLDGDGGLGKSTLALQLGVAVVANRRWLGQIVKCGSVIYVAAEDDINELHRRLSNICVHYTVGLEDLSDLHLWPLAEHDPALVTAGRDDSLIKTRRWHELEAAVAEIQPTLLVLDSRADVFGGNEISRAQARGFIGMLRALAVRCKLSILILAHPSLSGMSSGSGSSGSTHWRNAVRAALYLTKPEDVEGLPDLDARLLEVKKSNYGPAGASIKLRWSVGSFELADAPSGLGLPTREAAIAGVDDCFMRMLVQYNAQGRNVSDRAGANFAPALFAQDPAAGGIRKDAFTGAMNRLFAAGRLAVEEIGPPSRRLRKIVRAFQGEEN